MFPSKTAYNESSLPQDSLNKLVVMGDYGYLIAPEGVNPVN